MARLIKLLMLQLFLAAAIIITSAFKIQYNQLIISEIPASALSNKKKLIDWNKHYKLSKSDFKARASKFSGNSVANTYSGYGISITSVDGEISGSIFVRFNRSKSWIKSKEINGDNINYILSHEQLHFDICEIFGRKLYKEIVRLKKENKLKEKYINKKQSRLKKEYSDYQDIYDSETNHSINKEEQLRWNKKVARELEELSEYANYGNW